MFGIRYGLLASEGFRSVSKSPARLHMILQDLSNRIAPQEAAFVFIMLRLLRIPPFTVVREIGSGFLQNFQLLSDQFGKPSRLRYRVRQLSTHLTLFERTGATETVVVFGGNGGGPGMETWKLLSALHSTKLSYLVIHRRGTYEKGIPGLGDSAPEFLIELNQICSDSGLRVIGTFGSSGGSLPALYFASIAGVEKSIIAGPSNPITSNSWQELVSQHPLKNVSQLQGVMLVGSEATSDLVASREVNKTFPQLKTIFIEGAGHVPFEEMGLSNLNELFQSTFKSNKASFTK